MSGPASAGARGPGAAQRKRTAQKITATDAKLAAHAVLGMMEISAVTFLGPDAALHEDERRQIEPSMARLMERLPAAAAGAVNGVLDPFFLAVGMTMWGYRLWQLPPRTAGRVSPSRSAARSPGEGTPPGTSPGETAPIPPVYTNGVSYDMPDLSVPVDPRPDPVLTEVMAATGGIGI